MPTYTWTDTVTRGREFTLPAPWPQGAAIGELRKMLAHVDRDLEEAFGPDAVAMDDAAWVVPRDDEIVVRFELPEPDTFRTGKCEECSDPAEYTAEWAEREATRRLCPVHAAHAAASGMPIARIEVK